MPHFTIESTYRIPVYRQRTYEADSVEQACRLASEDDDWSDQKEDYESAGETYVSGAWPGEDTAYRVAALPVPSQFSETLHTPDGAASDLPFWRQRADAAIDRTEAILAGARDPE